MIVAVIRAQTNVDRPLPGHHASKPIAVVVVASPPDTPGLRCGTGNRYVRRVEAVGRVWCPGLVGRVGRGEGMCFWVLGLGCTGCLAGVELAAEEGRRSLILGGRDGRGHHRQHGDPGRFFLFQGSLGRVVDPVDMTFGDLDTLGLGRTSHLYREHVGREWMCMGDVGGPVYSGDRVDKDVGLVCREQGLSGRQRVLLQECTRFDRLVVVGHVVEVDNGCRLLGGTCRL